MILTGACGLNPVLYKCSLLGPYRQLDCCVTVPRREETVPRTLPVAVGRAGVGTRAGVNGGVLVGRAVGLDVGGTGVGTTPALGGARAFFPCGSAAFFSLSVSATATLARAAASPPIQPAMFRFSFIS